MRQYLNRKCKEGKIRKFDRGVYYFPSCGQLFGERVMPPFKVIERKYITDGLSIYGVYAGFTVLNMYGLSTQVPYVQQIASNKVSKKRVLTVGKTKIEVRKPPVTITKENCRAVEIAELLAQIPEYQIDNYKDRLQEVKKSITPVVSKKILREVITMYPAEVSKKAIQGDLL